MASVTSSTGAVAGSSTSDVFDFETMVRSTARFQAQRALTDPIPQSHMPARVIDRLYQESFKREGARYLWTKHAYVVIATRVYANGESEKQYLMAHFDLQDANKAVRGIQELASEHVYFEEHSILDWDETTTVDTYGDSCLMMYCNDFDWEGTKVALRCNGLI